MALNPSDSSTLEQLVLKRLTKRVSELLLNDLAVTDVFKFCSVNNGARISISCELCRRPCYCTDCHTRKIFGKCAWLPKMKFLGQVRLSKVRAQTGQTDRQTDTNLCDQSHYRRRR